MRDTHPTCAIPFFRYQGAFAAQADALVDIFRDVVSRGAYIQQRDLADFEHHLAAYLGIRHAIGVGNATDGLIMLWRAVGLQPGDEVVFPSHTMVASAASVTHAGGTPVPVDCGEDHLIDPASIEGALTPRTRFLLPVHLNGRTCAMAPLEAMAARQGLGIVEDAAQALGSRYRGRFAGTFGLGAVFSFYPAKILGCLGDGGAVVTDNDDIARAIRLLRDHGRNETGEVERWGLNSRLDNLQAAVLDHQLATYGTTITRRRTLASRYQELLGDMPQLSLPPAPNAHPDHFDVFQNYELQAEQRDALLTHLSRRGIGALLQWGGKAVHQFTALGLRAHLPATDRLFERCLMLPMNMTVTDDEVDTICHSVREFYGC